MKPFATILCLLAIAVNTAMGYTGGVLFCEHETGDAHIVSKVDHAAESHGENCHGHSAESPDAHETLEDCDSCTDTEVVITATRKATSNPSSERGPNSQALAIQTNHFEIDGLKTLLASRQLALSRAPPGIESLTVLQVEATVLRI